MKRHPLSSVISRPNRLAIMFAAGAFGFLITGVFLKNMALHTIASGKMLDALHAWNERANKNQNPVIGLLNKIDNKMCKKFVEEKGHLPAYETIQEKLPETVSLLQQARDALAQVHTSVPQFMLNMTFRAAAAYQGDSELTREVKQISFSKEHIEEALDTIDSKILTVQSVIAVQAKIIFAIQILVALCMVLLTRYIFKKYARSIQNNKRQKKKSLHRRYRARN